MQIKLRRTKLGRAKRQERCSQAAHCEHSPRTHPVRRRRERPGEAQRAIPPISHADRFRFLQILARDPAGNQYP
jgi:hypothetical protein